MASEARRGCGYRKIGGTYLVAPFGGRPCDRLPIRLEVCPTCSHGIKQARGWTWVDMKGLFQGDHRLCLPPSRPTRYPLCPESGCLVCRPEGKAGLLWVGGSFYPNVESFVTEARAHGISRRIKAVPRNFKVGETWVLLAHPKAIRDTCPRCIGVLHEDCDQCENGWVYKPGIFHVFRPTAIERIITETQSQDPEFMKTLEDQHLTPVVVKDDDKDHQGSVYDKEDEEPGLFDQEAGCEETETH